MSDSGSPGAIRSQYFIRHRPSGQWYKGWGSYTLDFLKAKSFNSLGTARARKSLEIRDRYLRSKVIWQEEKESIYARVVEKGPSYPTDLEIVEFQLTEHRSY